MKNIYNILFSTFVILALLNHIGSLAYKLTVVLSGRDLGIFKYIKSMSIEFYFFYQLPFDMLNMAIIAHIYQWQEIKHTLIQVLDMQEYHDDELESQQEDGAFGGGVAELAKSNVSRGSVDSRVSIGQDKLYVPTMISSNMNARVDMSKMSLFNKGLRSEMDKIAQGGGQGPLGTQGTSRQS